MQALHWSCNAMSLVMLGAKTLRAGEDAIDSVEQRLLADLRSCAGEPLLSWPDSAALASDAHGRLDSHR